jgi:NADH-quinone oxidoreductase subunit E
MDNRLTKVFASFEGKEEELIPVLQGVQNEVGFLSDDSMKHIARFVKIPLSKVYGVATFYAQFRFKPKGETHILLCRGTACHVKGAPRIQEEIENQLGIKEGETSKDLKYSLENVACIGACSLAPCVMVNGTVEANLTPQKVEKLFGHAKNRNKV